MAPSGGNGRSRSDRALRAVERHLQNEVCEFYDGFYEGSGGIETHIRDIVREMPFHVTIVADLIPEMPRTESLGSEVVVRRIGPNNSTLSSRPMLLNAKPFFPIRIALDLLRLRAKRAYLARQAFDLVHFHSAGIGASLDRFTRAIRSRRFAGFLMNWGRLGSRKVLTVHGLVSMMSPHPFVEELERQFILQFPHIICVDSDLCERVHAYARDASPQPAVHLIPNGVDVGRFPKRPVRPGPGLRIGFAGRLEGSRGVDILLGLIRRGGRAFEYRVAGIGSARDVRRFQDAVHEGSVELLPNLPYAEMPRFLEEIDVLLNPVVAPGMSRIALESMSMGRPPVMSRIGDRYPIIDGVTGFLVEHTVDGYADRLTWIAEHREALESCGARASELVRKEFTSDVMRTRVVNLYREILASRAGTPADTVSGPEVVFRGDSY